MVEFQFILCDFQKQNKVSLLKRDPHAENEWVFLECWELREGLGIYVGSLWHTFEIEY